MPFFSLILRLFCLSRVKVKGCVLHIFCSFMEPSPPRSQITDCQSGMYDALELTSNRKNLPALSLSHSAEDSSTLHSANIFLIQSYFHDLGYNREILNVWSPSVAHRRYSNNFSNSLLFFFFCTKKG